MKKIFFVSLLLLASIAISAKSVPPGYVDLGLPSGTLWKTQNEPGFYTSLAARYQFEERMPSIEQFEELANYCSWKLEGNVYRAKGPNGNVLYFPLNGYLNCEEELQWEGESTHFWVSGFYSSLYFVISRNYKSQNHDAPCLGHCVRLVISGE